MEKRRIEICGAKKIKKDKIRITQIDFLKSCLLCGMRTDQFEILEWEITKK